MRRFEKGSERSLSSTITQRIMQVLPEGTNMNAANDTAFSEFLIAPLSELISIKQEVKNVRP
jgi:hypothetical protein